MRNGATRGRDTKVVHAAAARCAVQLLFATAKSYTVDGLREKLRALLVEEANSDLRAVAALSTMELITALLSANSTLRSVGLQVRISNGVVSMWAGPVESRKLADHIAELTGGTGSPDLTQSMMEVLGCIVLKQPISQSEIDRYFDVDKRSQVERLLDLGLVEMFAGSDGRNRMVTTEKFRLRFGEVPSGGTVVAATEP